MRCVRCLRLNEGCEVSVGHGGQSPEQMHVTITQRAAAASQTLRCAKQMKGRQKCNISHLGTALTMFADL
jgi:hypothetical protein